jgi:1,2-diacylglycerol 3-beta-glucosyltransferase
VRHAVRTLLIVAAAPPAAIGAYLSALLTAAVAGGRGATHPPPAPNGRPRLVVLMPAHDEAAGIAPALRALAAADYPPGLLEIVVVADNCTDATAEVARAEGATVLERDDPERRGKPHALSWGLERLSELGTPYDAVLFLDADCTATPNVPAALAARLAAGAKAVQADYVVANPQASATAALRFAAFASICTVRPLGKARLGLSAGLLGTGMLLHRKLLERLPWNAFTLAEDLEYHLRLVDADERVEFASEAAVHSAMPVTDSNAVTQQSRWEAGRLQLARRWAPRLLAAGLKRRDPVRLHAGLELLVPSQSALVAWNAALAPPAFLAGGTARRLAALALGGQLVSLAGALLFVRAPAPVWRALLRTPALAVSKLGLYRRLARGGGPVGWERTSRTGTPDAGLS